MSLAASNRHQKPRELRRQIMLPVRMRTAAGWSDARILNLSSRGLLIHAGRPFFQDRVIEIWHQNYVIVARVVWRDGAKAGLQAADRVPIESIVCAAHSPKLQLAAIRHKGAERRQRPRTHEQSRLQSRLIEFASMVAVAAAIAGGAFALVSEALARPLTVIQAALGG